MAAQRQSRKGRATEARERRVVREELDQDKRVSYTMAQPPCTWADTVADTIRNFLGRDWAALAVSSLYSENRF